MTGALLAATSADCTVDNSHIFGGCGYPAPGLQNFNFTPMFTIGSWGFTKPELIAIICALLVIAFFWAAFRKPKLIPGRTQSLGEMAILAVRDQIMRPSMGRKGDKYLAYMVAMFFWILLCNLMELIPFFQFPAMARIGFVWPLVGIMLVVYWYVGFKTKGFIGYFKSWIPSGVPGFILVILIPVEILKYTIVQPFTLGIRLFANMFAGHLLLATFTIATWYLASATFSAIFAAGSAVMVVILYGFEMLIQALQAYIFTMLTAQYIGEGVQAAH